MTGRLPAHAPRAVPAPSRAAHVAAAVQLACLLEAAAPKPGNVSPGRHFADARFEDFLASAAAIGGPFADAEGSSVGATVRRAVEATAGWTRSNTNLGIVLLMAPLAHAALAAMDDRRDRSRVVSASLLRTTMHGVLAATTIQDASDVYAAIRCASPGGLGRADSQDVAGEPTVTLLEAMCLAADRDGIAREYATGFEVTFGEGAPALARARGDGLTWEDAIVETFLTVLAAHPDTHVARRAGRETAADISARASVALGAGGVRTDAGRHTIEMLDRSLRVEGNRANPGTTADLTAAAIFVELMNGGWGVSVREQERADGPTGRG